MYSNIKRDLSDISILLLKSEYHQLPVETQEALDGAYKAGVASCSPAATSAVIAEALGKLTTAMCRRSQK